MNDDVIMALAQQAGGARRSAAARLRTGASGGGLGTGRGLDADAGSGFASADFGGSRRRSHKRHTLGAFAKPFRHADIATPSTSCRIVTKIRALVLREFP